MFGQLTSVARLFAQFFPGMRKSLLDFWHPLLENPIKFVSNISHSCVAKLIKRYRVSNIL